MYPIRIRALVAALLFTATLFLAPTNGASQKKLQPEDARTTPSRWPLRSRCCGMSNSLSPVHK